MGKVMGMKVNEAIEAMMASRNYTKVDLAGAMGVSPQTIHYYVNGQKGRPTSVTVDTAFEVAEALGYTLAFVPSTRASRLPDGTIVVDSRLTEKRASRRSNKAE